LKELKRAAAVAAVLFSGFAASIDAQTPPVDSAAAPPVDSALAPKADSLPLIAPVPQMSSEPPVDLSASCGHPRNEINLRRAGVAAAFVGGNAILYSYMKQAWWSGQRADHFFFRADWDENFRDQDKFGHALGGYHLARFGRAFLSSACMSKTKAIVWSSAYAALFQVQIEIWDGLYEKYGFSYADILANTTGTALAVLHETHPRTRAIKPTISYWPSAAMRNADNIPGELRPSLDYSGQTYWLSADIDALLPESSKPYWPGFLRLSIGHSITDWIDPQTGANIRAKHKILLSLDFDAEKLPGNNRFWKTMKRQLSYIHLPAPAIEITPDAKFIGWYK
jgi:hypothetical protein